MNTHRYIKIPVSGTPVALEEPTALPDLQNIVGGYIEAVYTTNKHVLLVNDNRWIHDMKLNPLASALANVAIVGDVVLTGYPAPEGDDGEIEPHVAEMVLNTINN